MTWAIFLFTVILIVLIHEFGHYWVASLFNVAIKTFSLGFGKPIYSWVSKRTGAEFRLSPLLLGGYVQFSETKVKGCILFKDLSIIKQIFILLAGPIANFLLAFLLLLILFWVPSYQPIALFQDENSSSIYQVITVNQQPTQTWDDVWTEIKTSKNHVVFKLNNMETRHFYLKEKPINLESFLNLAHLSKKFPNLEPVIGKVYPNSLAEQIGLKASDKIVAINDEMIHSMNRLAILNQELGDIGYHLTWIHQGKEKKYFVAPHKVHGQVKSLGIASQKFANYPTLFIWKKLSFMEAFLKSWQAFTNILQQQSLGWFRIMDDIEHLSGPIGIGLSAQQAWYGGISAYLIFIVWINISVGLLNLMPLPILDGGQCLMTLLRAVFPKYFSEKIKQWFFFISFIVLIVFFFAATTNDWSLLQK